MHELIVATFMSYLWQKPIIRLLKTLCFIGIYCLVASVYASELPDLGNSSSAVLTPTQELELGKSIMRELQSAQILSQDIVVNEYLQSIGYRLIATQGQTQTPFQFFAVEDKTINAFALPGGFVGVNTGLIMATESEGELAGVLAHEVAHVQQKHIARMYEHMGRLRISTIAGLLASMILATQNAQAASGALAATLAGSQQALINFTREHEKEADFVGIHSLKKAGFDPMGMPAFFHRMSQETRFYGNHIPEYLLTHPLTESRLVTAQSRANSYPYKQVPDSLQYHLVYARVWVDSFSTASEACQFFAKKLERGNYRSRVGTLYGYALALINAGKANEAKSLVDGLLQQYPNQPLFQLAYAQIEMATQQQAQALDRLANALKNHPNNYPLTFTYAEWLIKTGQAQNAIPILKQQLQRKPQRPLIWLMLSAAYAQTRQHLQAHLAQAQYLKMQGDLPNALTQLKLASKLPNVTPQEKRQIESEQKEIKEKLS